MGNNCENANTGHNNKANHSVFPCDTKYQAAVPKPNAPPTPPANRSRPTMMREISSSCPRVVRMVLANKCQRKSAIAAILSLVIPAMTIPVPHFVWFLQCVEVSLRASFYRRRCQRQRAVLQASPVPRGVLYQ